MDADRVAEADKRVRSLETELRAVRAALTDAVRERDHARESLWIAEESVVRQKALLETATEMIEEARRWARSLWDAGPGPEEPEVLTEPEVAPGWLTADGPRRTARGPRSPRGADPASSAHALRLAALDRVIADVEEEWGPITAEEMATTRRRLQDRGHTEVH
ncbi:hypothetical protein [Blastococcus sp. PRF04-17]|uniref:hypothetical protein n=1 Tax=Blastococcus sp. PRF04-17 TaxID=2933797 RepID=UPI001FF61396|nr:hypothetical protein [Blastococcus sp. PRF04-17]UOY00293.1 hypothetical protein MVA48_14920 [Blastococcus sp. PRF04-17]